MGYQEVVKALGSEDRMQRCPAHEDRAPSLSVKEGDDGKALLYCHAGCATVDVVEALGLTMSDLFVLGDGRSVADTYVYTDAENNPLIRVIRTEPKGFTQQHWDKESEVWVSGVPRDIRRVLYNLQQLRSAVAGTTVYIVEGEKDVETLVASGYLATCGIGGANKWKDEYNDSLRHLAVVLVGDSDDVGRESVEKIGQSLTAAGIDYKVAFPPEPYKDVTEMFQQSGYVDVLHLDKILVYPGPDISIFEPLDWENYETEDIEWLMKPYVPRASRVLCFGSAGSLKSLWALWLASRLTNEGKSVAYFSLEMTPSDLARRLRQSKPTSDKLQVFTRLSLNNPQHVTQLIHALAGVDLVVVDSWTAAHKGADNDEVARLDNEVFKPLIATGTTLLILDNTGHPSVDSMGKKVATGYARGASAKGDKMEVTLWFDRPDDGDNYRTRMTVKKMRLDHPIPLPVTIETPRDRVEFYKVKANEPMYTTPLWPYDFLGPEEDTTESVPETQELTATERRALARLNDTFNTLSVPEILGVDEGSRSTGT